MSTTIHADYSIDATGDACVGDEVSFLRATFSGSHRKPRFTGNKLVTGTIVADSYGARKQQHTFTILLPDGSKTMIKGRNLYRNGLHRKPWPDESKRQATLDEKHQRGQAARSLREEIRNAPPLY